MNKFIDPKLYGLSPSTKLKQVGANQFNIIIERKSRIIMKDGEGILAKVNKIKNHVPSAKVCLKTSAPICSKTKTFLEEHDISVSALILGSGEKEASRKAAKNAKKKRILSFVLFLCASLWLNSLPPV